MLEETKEALLKINFSGRVEKLTQEHSFARNNTFEDYDNKEILKILNERGYKAKYNKSENFFKITEKLIDYRIQFHLSMKYGFTEFGWYLFSEGKYYDGDTWAGIRQKLDKEENLLKDPGFHSYEELKEILSEAFVMYEDFKREFLIIASKDMQ